MRKKKSKAGATGMPVITLKRFVAAVCVASAAALVVIGLLRESMALLLIANLLSLAVVGLVALGAYRRVGYGLSVSAQLVSKMDSLRESAGSLAATRSAVHDELRQAGVPDLQRLVLNAFRDVDSNLHELHELTQDANAARDALDGRLARLESVASASDSHQHSLASRLKVFEHRMDEKWAALDAALLDCQEKTIGQIQDVRLEWLRESVNWQDTLGTVLKLGEQTLDRQEKTMSQVQDMRLEWLRGSANWQDALGAVLKLGEQTSHMSRESAARLKAAEENILEAYANQWSTLEKAVISPIARIRRDIDNGDLRFPLLNDIMSMHSIDRMVDPRAALPSMTGWSLEPAALARLLEIVLETKPGLILECGSGASTVWLAYAAQKYGGKVIALEHLEPYAEATRRELARHDLAEVAEVRSAALETYRLADSDHQWYGRSTWDRLQRVGLLLVDGPPKATGDQARYPALPLLAPAMMDEAVIVLDDLHRPEERAILDRWQKEFPELASDYAIGLRTSAMNWSKRP